MGMIISNLKLIMSSIIAFFTAFIIFKKNNKIDDLQNELKKKEAENDSLKSKVAKDTYTADMEKEVKENTRKTQEEVQKQTNQAEKDKEKIINEIYNTPDNKEYEVGV